MHSFAALQRMQFNFFVMQALFDGLVIAGLCPSYPPMRTGGRAWFRTVFGVFGSDQSHADA
jgi:hypothetical protein